MKSIIILTIGFVFFAAAIFMAVVCAAVIGHLTTAWFGALGLIPLCAVSLFFMQKGCVRFFDSKSHPFKTSITPQV